MPGVEKAQRHTFRQRLAGEQGIQTGQRVPALVQCARYVACVRPRPVADEVPLRLLVRIEGTRQLGAHRIRGTWLAGAEGMGVQCLAERGDLALDLGEHRRVTRRAAASRRSPSPVPLRMADIMPHDPAGTA
ncbi:hypothetical protein OG788_03250 [Streptomyces sp. NBC_00647]|uniref:hypothetical protein n=1 Tax=Streptomyces sp. NBC_00647 TaxID=2975796 RepID=UPI003243AF64